METSSLKGKVCCQDRVSSSALCLEKLSCGLSSDCDQQQESNRSHDDRIGGQSCNDGDVAGRSLGGDFYIAT